MDADPDSTQILFQLLLLVFFTWMNAFFSGAEMAVVSVNKNRIRALAEEGNRKAAVIQGLFEDSTRFLSAIQIAITFAGFYSSASAASGISPILAGWLRQLNIPYASVIAHNGVTLVLMFFNLVLGELVPKRIALQKAEAFCMMTVMPIHYISILLSPIIRLLSVSTKLVLKLLGLKTEDTEETVTEEEIKALLKAGYENGTFDNSERKMINSVFAFDDKTAREVMVPRQDVFAVEIDEPEEEILDEVLKSRHSRIPVYETEIDNIIGVLNVRDLMLFLREEKKELSKEDLRGLLKQPYFVPEHKDADQLFREMQSRRIRMAILVDEYGGFSGIVTIEDLVEVIMGDISEEYEDVEPDIVALDENQYEVAGDIQIDALNDILSLKLESGEYDTLSGYIIEQLGYIPSKKHMQDVEACGWRFSIREIDGKKIGKVLMTRLIPLPEPEEGVGAAT